MSVDDATVGMEGAVERKGKAGRKPRGTVTRNPTTVAISKISAVLDELADRDAQQRVLGFITEEYDFGSDE